jgi:hypothetical protein
MLCAWTARVVFTLLFVARRPGSVSGINLLYPMSILRPVLHPRHCLPHCFPFSGTFMQAWQRGRHQRQQRGRPATRTAGQ